MAIAQSFSRDIAPAPRVIAATAYRAHHISGSIVRFVAIAQQTQGHSHSVQSIGPIVIALLIPGCHPLSLSLKPYRLSYGANSHQTSVTMFTRCCNHPDCMFDPNGTVVCWCDDTISSQLSGLLWKRSQPLTAAV